MERFLNLILMAAGRGTRFGSNKLLTQVEGKPLFRHAFDRLRSYRDAHPQTCQVIVVSAYQEILSAAEAAGFTAIYNDRPQEGISVTIRLGMAALQGKNQAEAAVFFTADQPFMHEETLAAFLEKARASERGLVTAASEGKLGNPVAFDRKYYPELLQLQGDRGGKAVLHRHPGDLELFEVAAAELLDIDYPPQ